VKSEELIRAEKLNKIYTNGAERIHVLKDLDLSVRQGEMVAVVGASGSGKSTLLHLLGGLDRPSSGRLFIDGFDIFSQANVDLARFRNEAVGFVFQFHALLPEFTALENVMMPLMIGGARRSEAVPRAAAMLESVGLADRAGHRPAHLSGGEQQRVAIARALIHEPRLLLADEPTGNLDSKTGDAVFSVLNTLHTAHGLTSVLVTHNERLASSCDRVLHLADGQLD
jgi:lipoprotein-releasing system ATP-binding protein